VCYWIPLYQILEQRGLEVYLVNAHYLKSVPGRKSDVSDCQWIQYLHSVGLLRASFRPPDAICAVRSLWRHRSSLLQMTSEHTLQMQKALSQMNLQIHHVLSDISSLAPPSEEFDRSLQVVEERRYSTAANRPGTGRHHGADARRQTHSDDL
jgi:hypothetical protein